MNLCESCGAENCEYQTMFENGEMGSSLCALHQPITRADLQAVQDQLAEARREIDGARVVIRDPTHKELQKIQAPGKWTDRSHGLSLIEAALARARQHARIERAT
jgi:hypothetical protein